MENRFKVELWIDDLIKALNSSNTFKFDHNAKDVIRIVNDNYLEIFDCLIKNKTIRIANLDFDDNNFYHVLEEQQSNSELYNNKVIFTNLKQDEQNKRLKRFKEENEEYLKKHSTSLFYISFGLLDYYDVDNKHTIASAPLVFLPLNILYNEEDNFYQIKIFNQEVQLNEQLINYIRQSKKVDISYTLDHNFSLEEYLLYVASKVHMFHFSVNNGCFISKFDINMQYYLEDVIEHQNVIANLPIIKSISYFNAEFYHFLKKDKNKLEKKVLSLLPVDNEEYRILKRIADRESFFIRTNNFKNKSHLLNNILLSFLLNNKKVLVVYENQEQKNQLFQNLDASLKSYSFDLNELSANKLNLLSHLNQYESTTYIKNYFDPVATQEVLDKYYETKNSFKKLINELRKKNEQFDLSLNECIEHYYRIDCPLLDREITKIDTFDVETFEFVETQISDFVTSLQKLKVPYTKHAFYGFNKNNMMQEDYLPLKDAAEKLTKDLSFQKTNFNKLENNYNFPVAKNMKELKGILNILSVLDDYLANSSLFKANVVFDKEKNKMLIVEKLYQDLELTKKSIIDEYGEKVFLLNKDLLNRINNKKNLSKKEIKTYKNYFKANLTINLDLIFKVNGQLKYYEELQNQVEQAKNNVNDVFQKFFLGNHYDINTIKNLEEKVNLLKNSIKYLNAKNLTFSYSILDQFQDENKKKSMENLKSKVQKTFNHIYSELAILQDYFDKNIFDFSSYNFDDIFEKVSLMTNDFVSINDYLEFYVARFHLNASFHGLADSFLNEDNFTLYEPMFYKRFYYDYANYLLNKAKLKNYKQEDFYKSLDIYNICEQNRENIVDSLLRTYQLDYLRNNLAILKRYEYDFVENEKKQDIIRPLSRITYLAHESIFHTIGCIFTPLKTVSKLLHSENYHFDLVICLANKEIKTSEMLSALYRGDQIIAFDEDYFNNDFAGDGIDKSDTETFLAAMKNSYETIDFNSRTYDIKTLQLNHFNPYFMNYLQNFLERSGFKVTRNVPFKNGYLDFVVKVENKSTSTAILIDRLPYYSLESTQESIMLEDKLLEGEYPYIRIFPFIFFLNEEMEKDKLITKIQENSNIVKAKKKVVKHKISDILFLEYVDPHEVYYKNKAAFEFNREKLFIKVLETCFPVQESVMIGIFKTDGLNFINVLLKEDKIFIKDKFIYLKNQPVVFKSAKNKNYVRSISSVAKDEIEEGILTIIKTCESIEMDTTIKLMLISLGYKTMNAKLYEDMRNIIIKMVHENKLTLHENILTIYIPEEIKVKEPMLVRDDK